MTHSIQKHLSYVVFIICVHKISFARSLLAFDDNDIGLEDYNGLGVFDGVLICHYNEEREQIYQGLTRKNEYNIYTLTNDELLLVDETKVKKI